MKILAALLVLSASLAMAQTPAKDAKKPATPVAKPTAPAAKPADPAKPAAKPAEPKKAEAPKAGAFVGNKESKTFHKADCKTAVKMKDANKTTFATKEEAEKAGFKACKVCLK